MLAEKIKSKLAKTIVEPKKALEASGASGSVLSMVASWHRVVEDGKERVDMAQFDFLVASGGKPLQVEVSYENGEFKANVSDLSAEMGSVEEEEEFVKNAKILSDAEVIEVLEKDQRVQEAMRRAKHLRVFELSFVIFDEEFEQPVWRVVLKNWPLTNYFKREKPLTIEAVVSGVSGKVLQLRKVI